jgi:hypothetical protein
LRVQDPACERGETGLRNNGWQADIERQSKHWCGVLQGDLNHWVDLMNRFDDVLERTAAALDPDGADAVTAPQPSPQLAALTVQVLRVTRVLLENCNNKHLYVGCFSISSTSFVDLTCSVGR